MKVLLADDEAFYLEWLQDYLESKGIEIDYASTVDDAILKLKKNYYRFIVVDLNIPILSPGEQFANNASPVYENYPGLYIANAARNSGYRTRQVIIYSVFHSKEIENAAGKLYCTYLTKMHPVDLRREVDSVLDYDPSADAPPQH